MVDVMGALKNKLGPLEAWQWGALAGGGLLVYRLATQGHQTTGPQTVTLTPNNQPKLANAGDSTIGGILSAFGAQGYAPTDFSITLPDGTVVSFHGGVLTTTPPAAGGGGGGPGPPIPPISSIGAPIMPYPFSRTWPWTPPRAGVIVNPLPPSRGGPVVGGTPGAYPGGPPAPSPPPITQPPGSHPPAGGGGGGTGPTPTPGGGSHGPNPTINPGTGPAPIGAHR